MANETKTDKRIIDFIREMIEEGADVNAGDDLTGRIPSAYSNDSMLSFEHTVSSADLAEAVR